MDKESPNRQTLIKYLLGELSEEERAEIAERYFVDDDWFDELLEIENELLDQYARGALNERERESFKSYLARLPDGQQKEAVARAFAQITEKEHARAEQILDEYAPASLSFWQTLLKWRWRQASWPQFAVAVSLVVIGIGLVFLFYQIKQLRNDNEQLRAQIAVLESEKELLAQNARSSPTGGDSDPVRQLEEQLRFEQQVNEAQAQQLANLQPATPVVVSWKLTSALRSADSPDQVTLSRGAKFVSIALPIESDAQLSPYRAILQTTTGEQRREQAGLRANKNGASVSLKLPADYFKATSYKLTLVSTGAAEFARDYYFTVIRR